LNDHDIGTENSVISFRVPHVVVKGPKSKRAKNVVEKNTRKKKKSYQGKCIDLSIFISTMSSNSCKYISDVVGEETRNIGDNSDGNVPIPDTSPIMLSTSNHRGRRIYKSFAWS
jgi:hypothetical protein